MRYVLQSMDILSMAFTGTLEATRVAMYGFDAAVLITFELHPCTTWDKPLGINLESCLQ